MIKYLEVRDRGTFIPVMAVALIPSNNEQAFLLSRAGYGGYLNVHLVKLNDKQGFSDAFEWPSLNGRTMRQAHIYIRDNFDELEDGDVIDIEYILGETSEKKISERF